MKLLLISLLLVLALGKIE
jgi:hypothetical protein